MKTMAIIAGIIALAPFVLVAAALAKILRSKHTPPMGTIGEDEPDPGVDVDGVPDQATLELLGYNDAVEFLEYRKRSREW